MRRIVIYGAGAGGRRVLERMRAAERSEQIVAFCDNEPGKLGATLDRIPIVAFPSLDAASFDLVIVASAPGRSTIVAELERRGLVRGFDFIDMDDPVEIGPSSVLTSTFQLLRSDF